MAHTRRLKAVVACAASAVVTATLLAGEPVASAADTSGGSAPDVAVQSGRAGDPVEPEWPAGTYGAEPAQEAAAGAPAAPAPAAPAAPAPAAPAAGAVLADVRPALTVPRVQGATAYEFVIGTGGSPRTGQVTTSGWVSSPEWRVPAGLLRDGGSYTWTARVRDRSGKVSADGAARSFGVKQRLGAQAPGSTAPADVTGPVSVGLANGNVSASVNTPRVNTGTGPLGATFTYNSQAVDASGLTGSYYAGDSDAGIAGNERPAAVREDARLAFAWGPEAAPYPGAKPGAAFRARWSGRLRVPATGTYRLGGAYDKGLRIWVDGKPVLDDWKGTQATGAGPRFGTAVTLTSGRSHDLRVEYRGEGNGAGATLWARHTGKGDVPVPASWLAPSGRVLPPGWSVTPGATGPAAAAAANVPPALAAGGQQADAPAQDPAPGPAAGQETAGRERGGREAAGKDAAHGPVDAVRAAEESGLKFSYAGSPECAPNSGAPTGFVCAVTLPGGGRSQLIYRSGKLVRFLNPGREVTDFGYTPDHRLTTVRTPLVMDWIAVDPRRRDTSAADYRIAYRGNSRQALRVTAPEPAGVPTAPSRRPEREYAYSADATEIRVAGLDTDRGWARRITHDPAGRLLTDTDATGRTVRKEWTAADQPASTLDAAGRMTTTVYDERSGRPSGTYGPGPRNCFGSDRRLVLPAPEGCEKVPAKTTEYGPTSTTTVRADGDGVPDLVTETQLSPVGLPAATIVDPKGLALKTAMEFDASFRLVGKVRPNGAKQTYAAYGATETQDNPCTAKDDPAPQRGLPKNITLAGPAKGAPRVEKFVFDGRGLPVAVTNGAADWTCVTYDDRSRMTGTFIPKDAVAPARTVKFDLAVGGDPLTMRASDSLGSMTFTTDLLGRTVRHTDTHGIRTETLYDRAGRPVQERTTPPNRADSPQVKTVRYDAAGRTVAVVLDRRTLAAVRYDAGGDTAGVSYGNGTRLEISRDRSGRILAKNWTLADGRTLVSNVTRSRSGTVTGESTAGENARPDGPGFGYDAAGRLTDAWVTGHHYSYDFTSDAPAGCPEGTRANAGANGNRVRLLDRTKSGTAETGYCYDAADRLLATTGAQAFGDAQYNGAGTLTGHTSGKTPVSQRYDAAERYVGIGTGGADPVEVTYPNDLLDLHAGRTITRGPAASSLLYGYTSAADHDIDLVLRGGDKRLLTRTVALPGGLLHVAKGAAYTGRETWNHPTVRGSIFLVSGADGRQTGDLYRYGPYGEPLRADGTVDTDHVPDNLPGDNDYAWLGQYQRRYEHAGSLSAYFLQTRVLNPATGRFAEPVTQGPFSNPYEYGTGDPVNHASIDGVSLKEDKE
ncbi:PA14 domain-containing protein [Streptomyces cinnamoneus]|uniref:PA14 domain-containing protein n=1 Tax=Streptomyces cinnamoneus TaxID=53446 RepID=UPI0033D723D2